MLRIARPISLVIWHRGRSHRRPNCSRSPNRKHFASLDLKKHADFSHRRPTSQDFAQKVFWHFPVISDQANVFLQAEMLFRIASDLGVCHSNRIAHRSGIARFGPLRQTLSYSRESPQTRDSPLLVPDDSQKEVQLGTLK